ncbi:hypothetical protein [Luteimonas salinilitoris]|uniref:Cellulose biosynthesis protein BcsF n=1 Tax=Luteimonas salinilitoris TaxID=3237697 RepID=A0ABV4HP78_9GAMM
MTTPDWPLLGAVAWPLLIALLLGLLVRRALLALARLLIRPWLPYRRASASIRGGQLFEASSRILPSPRIRPRP